jgi:hypothetical protein
MDTDIPDDAPTPPADLAAGMEDTADAAATGREPAPAPAPQPEPEKTTVAAAEPQGGFDAGVLRHHYTIAPGRRLDVPRGNVGEEQPETAIAVCADRASSFKGLTQRL